MNFSVRVRTEDLLRGLRWTGHVLAEAVEEARLDEARELPGRQNRLPGRAERGFEEREGEGRTP